MINNFTTFETAKSFLSGSEYALLSFEEDTTITLAAQVLAQKRNVKLKSYVPHNFYVKVMYNRAIVSAKLFFTDKQLVLDFGEAEEIFTEKWQTFVYYSLQKKESIDYLRYLESEMIDEFKEIDKTYLDLISENPEKEEDYVEMHDRVLKDRTIEFRYLKELEREAGITYKGYDPFHHPFFNPEQKKPERLIDIVLRRNELVRNQRAILEAEEER